jgi:hypothetical protein
MFLLTIRPLPSCCFCFVAHHSLPPSLNPVASALETSSCHPSGAGRHALDRIGNLRLGSINLLAAGFCCRRTTLGNFGLLLGTKTARCNLPTILNEEYDNGD